MAGIQDENSEEITLNIMPLLDIFSILILFLLMNFSTEPAQVDLKDGVQLPESKIEVALDDVPRVVVGTSYITVGDKKILDFPTGQIPTEKLQKGMIEPLYQELKQLHEELTHKIKEIDPSFSSIKSPSLVLEVDKSVKFRLIKQVMLSAQQADFIEFKLMVSKEIL